MTKQKNKGLEGTAWDAKNERLYAAKERKPIMIKEVEMSKNGITRALPSAITASVSDVSGLEYHRPNGFAAGVVGRVKNDSGGQFRVAGARSIVPDGGVVRAQRRYTQQKGLPWIMKIICILWVNQICFINFRVIYRMTKIYFYCHSMLKQNKVVNTMIWRLLDLLIHCWGYLCFTYLSNGLLCGVA